ncbi:asparagine synthase (glutamine-hydrolyzing) [Pseudomonas trivialis]|uniref:asparagine synthase (glutamine-hydrolyzing) n=1 Tax=Pseudomonas trivialis TaxID=200450 RepID=A0A0H5A2M8_9PSED|nr:asparagine synthase (glutamine-hydrolyzing) [Pseudomonas trivialis]AKS05041.1 asparagine synthase [Pseudomonas trivialis]
MCGYIGVFAKQPRAFNPNMFDAALRAIHHRGPDSSSQWFDPKGQAAFGYVRLGLVGLGNGTQPIVADEGDLVMMVNGEFYDYQRIRAELESDGCRFKTSSDSEIAMHLYRRHGVRGLKQLRGEFTILIFDRLRKKLFAVRDRVGVKPLYYTEHEGAWYFASEIKALLAAGVPAQWDNESYANRGFILRDRTLFNNIRSVKPGCWIIADESGLQTEQYWDWDFPDAQATEQRSEAEIIDSLRSTIEESVRLRLHADVPVGVCLSGGLDSSAMLGIATELTGQPLQAFHLSFEGEQAFDERQYAEVAARHNRAHLNVLSVNSSDMADNFENALWHAEMPFANAHSVAKYLLCKYVQSQGMRAVLTGEGADEVFGGYPHYRRDMVLYNHENQDPAVIAELSRRLHASEDRYLPGGKNDVKWVQDELGHGVSWLQTQSALFGPLAQLYNDDFRERFSNTDAYREFYDRLSPRALNGWEPVNRSLYMVAKSSLPNVVLTSLGDRMEMAGSLEGRPPLLDHQVIEAACRLPVNMKVRGATEKYALREAMRPYVPQAVLDRKKQYFRAPPASESPQSKLYEMINDVLSGPALSNVPFFDPRKVRALLATLPSLSSAQRASADNLLMEIAGLCLMQKRFALN